MTILARLKQWSEQGTISSEQHLYLAGLCRREPFSVFLELNILLYAGVLAFVAGLGWTVTTWSQQLGDVVIVAVLSAILAACFWYCFSRAPAWSVAETSAPGAVFDYTLYLGSLVWCIELAYLENRFHVLSGQWDLYLLVTAGLFFFLAYRFDKSLRAVAGFVLACRMVRAKDFALAVASGRDLSAICSSLLPVGGSWRDDSAAARPEVTFLRHLSECRGQRFVLGVALRRVRSGRLRGVVSGFDSCMWRIPGLGTEAPPVCLRCLRSSLRLRWC